MPIASTNPALLITVDRERDEPLHRQIEVSVRDAIRAGRLAAGASLPPSRVLAADLGVSRGVVVEAYQQLGAEGYLVGRVGGKTEVAAGVGPTEPVISRAAPAAPPLRYDLAYGRADVANFPRAAWMRALRSALTNAPNDAFGYPAGPGMPQLRTALADYLNRVRGTSTQPENVVVCTGYAQGVGLVVQFLAARGAKRLAVEDPSSRDDAIPAARAAGLDVVGTPVDADGIDVDRLRTSQADAVILTPAHQWPTGAVLSAAKRASLIAWAHEREALIIEDDYDAEYRYDGSPVGALQGLAPDRVIYGGSASKTLAPGIRLGWLIAPPPLAKALGAAKIAADRGSPALEQLALADLLHRGDVDRHLRRMRPVYRRRRDVLLASLATHLPQLRPAGISAGMHLLTWLPGDMDETRVIKRAATAGIRLDGLRPYRLTPGGQGALVFGYAAIHEAAIPGAISALAEAIS